MDFFEDAVFETPVYDPSEYALGSLGIAPGHFVDLFSDRECHSVFMWRGIISKMLLVWTQIFFHAFKTDAFSKISGYAWMGP